MYNSARADPLEVAGMRATRFDTALWKNSSNTLSSDSWRRISNYGMWAGKGYVFHEVTLDATGHYRSIFFGAVLKHFVLVSLSTVHNKYFTCPHMLIFVSPAE